MNRAPGLLRFGALCAVVVAIAQSIVAASVIDGTGVVCVLIAAMGLVWVADLWEARRGRPAGPAPVTPLRVTREFAQPALLGALVGVLILDPPMWQALVVGVVALTAPAAAVWLVRLAQSGTAPAERSDQAG